MATTTPNFGWSVPTSTDLVKDGATAIETLGDSIDASLLDLKGGTSGQVLAKNSNTDMDFIWVAQDDSNAIQNAIVDAKGDLIGATAADTPARLAVGTNGQVLTADSTAATGLAWATPTTAVTFAGCLLTKSANQSISNNTNTNVTFDLETFDTNSYHSIVSNTERITIPTGKAGKYLITAQANFPSNATGQRFVSIFDKNADVVGRTSVNPVSGDGTWTQVTALVDAAVADYFYVVVYQSSGGSLNVNGGYMGYTTFSASYLGA